MGAGDRAAEQAHRHRSRVQRLEQQLARAQAAERAWDAGAAGERLVAETLESARSSGWHVLHDLAWPGRPRANIDHIAVGPAGVLVVDAKNWSGRVTMTSGLLRQNGRRREREVEGVLAASIAVANLMEARHAALVTPVLCLAGSASDLAPQSAWAVTVVGRDRLPDLLGVDPHPAWGSPHEPQAVAGYLAEALHARPPATRALPGPPTGRRGSRHAHPV